jgi:hypothetical protein
VCFDHLPQVTRRTRRHNRDEAFFSLANAVGGLVLQLPLTFHYQPYEGSVSWLGSAQDSPYYLGQSSDFTIWKLCFYGIDDFAFGVRRLFADQFNSLCLLPNWDRVFQVPPHYRTDQWFVGFPVRDDEESVERVLQVVQAIYDELNPPPPPRANADDIA